MGNHSHEWQSQYEAQPLRKRSAGCRVHQLPGTATSFVDALVAKRTLLDTLACSGAEDKLFTNRDMGSFMYRTLLLDNDWQPGNVCSPEFQEFVTQKAVEFTSTHLGLFDVRAPFVGVTVRLAGKGQEGVASLRRFADNRFVQVQQEGSAPSLRYGLA